MVRITTITRRFEFDYGHRVLGHKGKCRFPHGHRARAEVVISVPELNSLGMVMDFGEIKERIGTWIDKNWDHNFLFNSEDPLLKHFQETEERKPFIMPNGNPTAENIAEVLFNEASKLLGFEFNLILVRMFETPNCWAEFRGVGTL